MYKPKASGFLRVRGSGPQLGWDQLVFEDTLCGKLINPCLSSGPFWDSGRDGTGKKKRQDGGHLDALGNWQEEKSSVGVTLRTTYFQQFFEKHLFLPVFFNGFYTTTLARSCIRQTESRSIGNYFTQELVHNGTTGSLPSSLQRDC